MKAITKKSETQNELAVKIAAGFAAIAFAAFAYFILFIHHGNVI